MPTLEWADRDKTVLTAQKVPFRLLDEEARYSYGDKDARNMLIRGDNLDA